MFHISSLTFIVFYIIDTNILNSYSVCARKSTDPPVHLILKNVNIPLSKSPIVGSSSSLSSSALSNNKNYELVDFSVYLPKSIRQTKSIPAHDTFIKHKMNTPTINSGMPHGYTPQKQLMTNNQKGMITETYQNNRGIPSQTHRSEISSNFYKPHFEGLASSMKPHFATVINFPQSHFEAYTGSQPHFEALTGLPKHSHFETLSSSQKPRFEALNSSNKPHFEALTASASSTSSLPKPGFESLQVHPSPKKSKYVRGPFGFHNTGYVTPSPNFVPTTWRPKLRYTLTPTQYAVNHPHTNYRSTSSPQNYFIPTPTPSITTKFMSPRMKTQMVTPVTTNLAPRFEALSAPRPFVSDSLIKHFRQAATKNPNTHYYNAASASHPQAQRISSTYTTEPMYDSSARNSNSNSNLNPNPNQNNQRVQSLPRNEVIMNNVVYHHENYGENSNQDSEQDNSSNKRGTHRNREQPGETKRAYRTMPLTTQYPPEQSKYVETKTKRKKPNHKRGVKIIESRLKEMVTESSAASLENDSPELLESKRMENMIAAPSAREKSQPRNANNQENEEMESIEQREKEQKMYNDETDNIERPQMDAAAQAISDEIRYFQDIFVAQNSPSEMEFGHIMDSPDRAEERYEKNDRKNQRYQGKVKWTDKEGGYGEHYWDLGHAKSKPLNTSKEKK